MPVDHRRINGPENSEPYHLYSNLDRKKFKDTFYKLKSTGQRSDERKSKDLRKIYVKTGVVTQAKGSAYIELQNTKVIVSVFDPREIPNKTERSANGQLYCDFKFAPFSCKRRRGHQQDAEEKEYSAVMRRALESVVCRHEFPNFQVDVYALVLENDGSTLSAAITCAGVALAHAGVPMYDLLTAVTLGKQGDKFFLDPTCTEEILCSTSFVKNETSEIQRKQCQQHGILVLAVLSTHQQISEIYQTGCFSLDSLTEGISVLIEASKEIVPLIEKCLTKFVIKHVNDKKLEEEQTSENKTL